MKQRKTKYRTWDKENKVMITFNNMERCDVSFYEMARGEYGFILMQYTGLKDKSGKEIYEGDIVKVVNKKEKKAEHMQGTGVVGFNTNELTFGWSKTIEGRPYQMLTWGGTESVEIIGNIYENKDLLK